MAAPDASCLRSSRLRAALADAMTTRDRAATAVFRSAMSAIANAEAVELGDERPVGRGVTSAAGVGRTEAARRSLTSAEEIEIVNREVRDRLDAAELLATTRPDAARRLRTDAGLLQGLLESYLICE
jgi:uncharacterized protein YqeY